MAHDRPQPLPDDERWREAIELANIPTLLLVTTQLTGDRRWLDDPYRPTRGRGLSDNDTGGLSGELQAEVRSAAFDAIMAWRHGTPVAIADPDPELLVEMMSVSLGETVPPEYAGMIRADLAQRTETATAAPKIAPPPGFRVIIIGAGMSGICAAVRLREAGVPFTIIEKHDSVGGTWLENRYPGCGVDVPSHLYSYTFAPNDWSRYFALRDEIYAYFRRVADDFGVAEHVRFRSEVKRATYQVDSQEWQVDVAGPDGATETLLANVLISAVGAFNKPKMPNVPGLESFTGPSAHTARWPAGGIDLDGKRVAVIGTGASAMQVVPAIAGTAASVAVFQRSPQWASPFEKFQVPVPEPVQFLLREFPLYHAWYRIRLSWAFNDRIHSVLTRDPEWPHPDRSINAANDGMRRALTRYIESELGDRQDLLPRVLPDYPPFAKRMLLDNGWFRALRRDNVELFAESVIEVRSNGVVSESGELHEADVLIWATGFDVVHFLVPLEIVGRSGRTIHEVWKGDDARAFLGTAVPDFPNFFCLYGPNTQFGHGGSLISVIERQMHYVLDVLQQMFSAGVGAIEVRADVHDEYNARVDAAHEHMIWTHPGSNTYFCNSKGRVVVNNPFRIVDVWQATNTANLGHYVTEPALAITAGANRD